MELVEGELLRDMLTGGPIPLQKAIPIATQTADGLAKAHEAGVLHRDLKPENLMVSRDGFVKILDFGLAKLVNRERSTAWCRSIGHVANPSGGGSGHHRVHVSGASERSAAGLPVRPVFVRISPVRNGDWKTQFPTAQQGRNPGGDSSGRSGTGSVVKPPGSCAALLGNRTLPRQGSQATLYIDP